MSTCFHTRGTLLEMNRTTHDHHDIESKEEKKESSDPSKENKIPIPVEEDDAAEMPVEEKKDNVAAEMAQEHKAGGAAEATTAPILVLSTSKRADASILMMLDKCGPQCKDVMNKWLVMPLKEFTGVPDLKQEQAIRAKGKSLKKWLSNITSRHMRLKLKLRLRVTYSSDNEYKLKTRLSEILSPSATIADAEEATDDDNAEEEEEEKKEEPVIVDVDHHDETKEEEPTRVDVDHGETKEEKNASSAPKEKGRSILILATSERKDACVLLALPEESAPLDEWLVMPIKDAKLKNPTQEQVDALLECNTTLQSWLDTSFGKYKRRNLKARLQIVYSNNDKYTTHNRVFADVKNHDETKEENKEPLPAVEEEEPMEEAHMDDVGEEEKKESSEPNVPVEEEEKQERRRVTQPLPISFTDKFIKHLWSHYIPSSSRKDSCTLQALCTSFNIAEPKMEITAKQLKATIASLDLRGGQLMKAQGQFCIRFLRAL